MTPPSQYRRVFTAALASAFLLLVAFVFVTEAGGGVTSAAAAETGLCAPPVTNPIACENSKEGDPPGDWQIDGIGDESIQGFATAISVEAGETENFKIQTNASKYTVRILRLGYYGGDGARVIEPAFKPSATLPQKQPECLHEEKTGLTDCGNWAVSASWKVPSTAVSGLYMAELERSDTGGESQIFFVVSNKESTAPIVLKTSDATWEAYNAWGGNSLYTCTNDWCPEGEPEAYKAAYSVSYNRPFDGTLKTDGGKSDPLYAEYQMMRFLEKEGYNVTYVAGSDIAKNPALLKNHKVFISSGHDEYWSAGEREAVEAAREAGVNLAFFSGNEVFWKTRWGPSMEGAGPSTEYRTLTTYKETHFNKAVDPLEPKVATSTWSDPRFKSGGAGNPPNSLTGQYFTVNTGSSNIQVPGTFAKLRFWRNTAVSRLTATQTLTLDPGGETLGYEWDSDADNGFRPGGRIPLSSTTVNGVEIFTDYGTTVKTNSLATHSLSLYRAPSGALVFGAGTVQWSWGLEYVNAWNNGPTQPTETEPDPTMQQATINLLADMGAQPSTVTTGLLKTTESTDHTAPTTTITSPTDGQSVKSGEALTIKGTAADVGGVVAGVEVSVDGGKTWHPATGTTSWTYSWNVDAASSATVKARAIDDSANIGAATTGVNVTVNCPCSMLGTMTPATADAGDTGSINLGVKFKSEIGAKVNGIRFFKSSANTGTHVGELWTAGGELLAQATFTNETSTGWQQVTFSSPVTIQPNTTYVASYFAPKGHYADSAWQLDEPPATGSMMLEHGPMHILADTEGGNGVFEYSNGAGFPQSSYHADNYWVDILYTPNTPPAIPGTPAGVTATAGTGSATIKWTAPTTGGTPASYKVTPYVGTVAQTATTVSGSLTSVTVTGLKAGTSYTFTVAGVNEGGTGPESTKSNAVTPTAITVPGAPTGPTATAGGASATVKWTAPTSNGGAEITSYKVVPYKAGVAQTATTVSGETTQTLITSLTPGSSYTFKVAAINSVGTSAESAASNAVIPTTATVAGAPTAVTAAAKSSGAVVTWTAPTANGGSPITGYKVVPYLGSVAQAATTVGTTTSATVNGLTNGSAYTFKVAAINGVGTGAESAASTAVTPYDSIFDQAAPGTVDAEDGGAVTVGVKFQSEVPGVVTGIRFYKAAANTGTHVGYLWTTNGEMLAQVTFTGESASGWQQAAFSTPVAIQANTTYIATYLAPNGHYSVNGPNLATPVTNGPLHTVTGENGLYDYGSGTVFPTSSFASTNYWVDVLFAPEPPKTAPGAPTGASATAGIGSATVTWTAPASNGGSAITGYKVTPIKAGVAQTAVEVGAAETTKTINGLTGGTSYTFTVAAVNAIGTGAASSPSNAVVPTTQTVPGAPTGVSAAAKSSGALVTWTAPGSEGGTPITGYKITPYLGGVAQTATTTSGTGNSGSVKGLTNGSAYTFTVAAINAVGTGAESGASGAVTPYDTIFDLATPETVDVVDPLSINVGVKFQSDVAGQVTGIRFYKAATNTGTHIGELWTSGGELLAQATFTTETASGWQQVAFSSPVTIQPNTTYVASYFAPNGHYSADGPDLASSVDNAPLHALGGETNGVYAYAATAKFPTESYESSNYWVDVLFRPGAAPAVPSEPTGVEATAGTGAATVNWTAPTGGDPALSYVVTPYVESTAGSAKTISGSPPATSTTISGLTPGTSYTFTVKASNAAGAGPESSHSNAVVPAGAVPPGAPTGVTASAGNASAALSWKAPTADGGSAITGYRITPFLGTEALAATTVGASVTSGTVKSLTNGGSYTFKVAAINAAGAGTESAVSGTVVPRVTIFETGTPATPDVNDSGSVVLGVKFSSTSAGKVRGIRFYKAATNKGTHKVGIWTSTGGLLAEATVTGETASGWQEALFATPVNIAANTLYVAAYLAPNGHYSANAQGFASAVVSSPLTAPASGTTGNGLYAYSSTLVFPTSTYNATNYWVDVLFTP
jgi:predicted phage tail protein